MPGESTPVSLGSLQAPLESGATVEIEGVRDPGGLGPAIIAWSVGIASSLLLQTWWLLASLVVFMSLHLASLRRREPEATGRLVVSPKGVAYAQGDHSRPLSRWHLYDEVRIEAHGETQGALPRWKLIMVNAYKPSISTYLHSRGTDAPIFSSCLEHVFAAPASVVPILQQLIQRYIDTARGEYRAIDLKRMDHVAPDPEKVFRHDRCPACARELAAPRRDGRCPACGHRHDATTFTVPGTPIATRLWIAAPALIAVVAAILLWLGGRPGLATGVGTVALLTGVAWFAMRVYDQANEPRAVVATRQGLEVWPAMGDLPRSVPWSDLRTVRSVRLESERWRFAAWEEAKSVARYNAFLFSWLTNPAGAPLVDMLIEGNEDEGELVCRELERRAEA